MSVLLSIKPEYVERIFNGTKRYEFRRVIFRKPTKRVVIYATHPVKKIVGEFTINSITHEDIEVLWRNTRRYAGITEDMFFRYFHNRAKGYAIQIGDVTRYNLPQDIRSMYGVTPPQSFVYVGD